LIDEALKANPDLDAAQASLRRANAALYAQQGTLFPTISANGSTQQLRASGVQQGGSVDTQLRLRSDDDIARLKALEAQMELARGRASRSARCSPCSSCRPSTSCSPRMIPRRA
jgi:outer membrane protein TolC